jgi:UDP-galactopyranose mutase
VLTCPLDVLREARFGRLNWRASSSAASMCRTSSTPRGAMVVNHPREEFPFSRIHETKYASGQKCSRTAPGFEFTRRAYPLLPD